MKSGLIWIAILSLAAAEARSQGIIIRPDYRPSGLELRRHSVRAEVQEQVAVVTVEHEFYNPGSSTVEGTFLFPLPPQAQVSRFVMHADGKEMVGELLSSEEARQIYEDIVRQHLDPALLEMADYRTFRARIFPIPPKAKRLLTLRYDATLPTEGNTVKFQYPMQGNLTHRGAGGPMPLPIDPMRPMSLGEEQRRKPEQIASQQNEVRVSLRTATALRNIYSPTHRVEVQQTNDRQATVVFEGNEGLDGRDFLLYYSINPNDIGATLLTHRPDAGKPGYFLLLISPKVELGEDRVAGKDLVLVLDISGSMAGEKIEQAKAALRYCLQRIGDRDRFGLVTFSSESKLFRPTLAGKDAVEDALWHVDQLEATGGTNIDQALLTANDLLRDSGRGSAMVVFLTDGLPSSGVTDEGQIRRNLKSANRNDVRVFTFGVGFDVNTRLLDGISREHHGFADYISPQENIEEKVSGFYDKVRYPVLSAIEYEFRGAEVRSLSPARLPDLFKGGQIILTGRYQSPGRTTLVLRGTSGEKQQSFQYDFELPEREREQDFVARLWATRRVGDLLEEIRVNGENDELKNEVVALAKEFGLVTPYTSYLVKEEEAVARNFGRSPGMIGAPAPMLMQALDLDKAAAPPSAESFKMTTGAGAVQASSRLREMKQAEVDPSTQQQGLVAISGRTMVLSAEGVWMDSEFKPVMKAVQLVFASEAYFNFLRLYPEARNFCKLGQKVIFKFRNQFVQIGESGKKQMSEAELRKLFDPVG